MTMAAISTRTAVIPTAGRKPIQKWDRSKKQINFGHRRRNSTADGGARRLQVSAPCVTVSSCRVRRAAAVSQSVCSVAEMVSARRTDKYDENTITIIVRDFGVAAACNRAVAGDVRISDYGPRAVRRVIVIHR